MLKQLRIRNYAIIEEIIIEFSSKLNVITGETGAGKSILAEALALILGERADSSVLLDRNQKCFVEGLFDTENKPDVKSFLEKNDLDAESELVIRREIAANGKSRAFVNDTPVNLEQLRQLSSILVDLHQQFDTLALAESPFQREVLDAMAGNFGLVGVYHAAYQRLQQVNKELQILRDEQSRADKEADYNKFLLKELMDLDFKDNEIEDLENELKLLTHAEGIKSALSKVSYHLAEGDQPLIQEIKSLAHLLQPYVAYQASLSTLMQRLHSAQIELRDIASEVDSLNDHFQFDAGRIEEIQDRISAGYKLLKKHGAQTTKDLLELKRDLEKKLQVIFDLGEKIIAKEKEANQLMSECLVQAKALSMKRKDEVNHLEKQVNRLLVQVGMPNARLKVQMESGELNPYGMDRVEFLFDANKSNRFEPIRKVASGGELSRLMLCIKSLVAKSIDLPTLLFDEIDTGISGEAARQVGIILKDLSTRRQVISITHQPQIAGKADAHYFVYKEIQKEKIHTHIRLLNDDERIVTIAKMLSGEKPTAAAMENAREMLTN